MEQSAKYVDILGAWNWFMEDYIIGTFAKNSKITTLGNLEPWFSDAPWSAALKGKKVLVVHPFQDSIEQQYKNRALLFPGTEILPEFELITYKAVQSIAGNYPEGFKTWFEALDFMTEEIEKIDFDVAIIGMAGYFEVLGLGKLATIYGRAIGFFKDPNVFSTFLILPAIMLVNGLILGTERRPLLSSVCLLTIMGGIFLAFSRGAWINFVMSVFLLVVLTFTLSGTPRLRSRIFVLSLLGLAASAVLLVILLSIPDVRELFLERFTLIKNYDAGEKGRFGNQLNSIPMLLDRPLGFGPRRYALYFDLDPHNVYINAFSSYGWLGGISYIVLLICTIIIGLKTILMRSPWQRHAIVVFCPLVAVIFQGVQIDTDHWRHFYWMLGLMWGLFAASLQPALVRQSEKTVRCGANAGFGMQWPMGTVTFGRGVVQWNIHLRQEKAAGFRGVHRVTQRQAPAHAKLLHDSGVFHVSRPFSFPGTANHDPFSRWSEA